MKKIILLLMVTMAIPAYASYNPDRPEWKDFCPYGYEDITTYSTESSIPGTDRHWKIKEQNYWVDRRHDFEHELSVCDEIADNQRNQNACYKKLTERQNRLNQTTKTPMQMWEEKKAERRNNQLQYLRYDAMKNKNYTYHTYKHY